MNRRRPHGTVIAMRGRSIFMPSEEQDIKLNGAFVDAQWFSPDEKLWFTGVERDVFMSWARNEFRLACNECYKRHKVRLCGHVEFPDDLVPKAEYIAKIIRMELM